MVSLQTQRQCKHWVPVSDCMVLSPGEWKGQEFEEGGKGFLLSFFLFCDFYQNTEIQHTHKPAQKRSALFTAAAGTCPPGQPPAGRGGRGGQPHQQGEEMRQEETEGKTGGSKETKRREKLAAERKGTEWGDLLLPLSPHGLDTGLRKHSCRGWGQRKREGRGSIGLGRNGRGAVPVVAEMEPQSKTPHPALVTSP